MGLSPGALPLDPAKELFGNLLASLGANLPAAKFAKFIGISKTLKNVYLVMFLKVLGILKPFFQEGFKWGVKGAMPPR